MKRLPGICIYRPLMALVIGDSGGIGKAIVSSLRADGAYYGVKVVSRSRDGMDLKDEHSIAEAAASFDRAGLRFDLIFVATGVLEAAGAPPEKSFATLTPQALAEVFAVNAIGPALLIKYFAPLLTTSDKAIFAILSARVGSIGDNRLGGWMSYRASKSALNQLVKCAAIEYQRSNPQAIIVALHPGTIESSLTRKFARGKYTSTPEHGAEKILTVLAGLTINDTGKFIDYNGAEIDW